MNTHRFGGTVPKFTTEPARMVSSSCCVPGAKRCVKRILLTEAQGIPVGLAMDGANRHDMNLVDLRWTI